MSEEHDERALIERCRTGDDTAFGELVDQHKNLVYGLVYRMVSDRSRVDDLAQDVFLKVYRGLPYFRGEARLSTWIYRIVQNVCAAARSRRAPDVSLDQEDASGRRHDPGAADGAFGDLELRDRLEKAIAQLARASSACSSPRTIWTACSTRRWPKSLNIPLGTVKTHLYRAKKRLRELLDT